jgi:hypothetical protein
MPKPNYGQVKRQKENARKARHQKKLERRQTREPVPAPDNVPAATGDPEGNLAP